MRTGLHACLWWIREAHRETVVGVEVRREGRSMSGVHLRPRGSAPDAETEGATGRPFSSPSPSGALERVHTAEARQ